MKKRIAVLLFLKLVTITRCCNCWYEDWGWAECEDSKIHSLGLFFDSIMVAANCSAFIVTGTSTSKLGKITSAQVTAEGHVNGIPVTYSDPFYCEQKEMDSNDDTFTYAMTMANPVLCQQIDQGVIDMKIPFSENEMEVIQSVAGRFVLEIRIANVNGVPQQKDCYHVTGLLVCEEEDSW